MTKKTIVSIRSLYKIFGAKPKHALQLVKDGVGKGELMTNHKHVLGLQDINIDMKAGEITVIMGLSGSGKSTLIRHINRLIEPTAGELEINGSNVMDLNERELREFRKHDLSMVFQKFALLPHKTIRENVALSGMIRGEDRTKSGEASDFWLERVGLDGFGDSYPHQLSGGMQQRVGIARALASDAEVMLMDEAFSALDPLIRTDMQDLLIELQAELHKSIVFITHDLDEALKLADHLVILKDGLIVQQGDPQTILLNPADAYVYDFVRDINRARVLRVRSVMSAASHAPGQYSERLHTNDSLEKAIALSKGSTDAGFTVHNDEDQIVGSVTMKQIVHALVPG